jgi:hypothetical protein
MIVRAGVPEMILPNVRADCFELNVVQSVAESAPFWAAEAIASERVCPERESQFASQRVTAACASPESVAICHWRLESVVLIVATAPESTVIFVVFCAIFDVLVATWPERIERAPESAARLVLVIVSEPEKLLIVFERFVTIPERVLRLFVRVAIFPESVAILVVFCPTVPEKEFTEDMIGPRVKVNIFTWFERLATCPERVSIWGWKLVPV